MPTLVKDPPPAGFEELLERRRELGQDRLDEVWKGVYVMNPAPSEDWLGLEPSGESGPLERSRLIELGPSELAQCLDWPPPAS